MNGEFQLPEPIIQHIQSFLTAKQVAQTATLSKSWRKAWLTRPNLDFDESDYHRKFCHEIDEFSEFSKKTIQRYEESNLKIESFRLSMERLWYGNGRSGLANELIVRALKIGTHLSLLLDSQVFVLPHEVFGAENLIGLSVEGCKIDPGLDRMVRCSRLKSLSLRRVNIESDLISYIISSCPLIEKLSLSYIFNFEGPVGDDPINPYKLHKLRCLVMCGVVIDTLFFGDLSSKFPFLKDLTLQLCKFEEDILISSRSLHRLNILQYKNPGVRTFDVPSIRKFTFEGSAIPSLFFKSTSMEWESHVSITHGDDLSTLWFRNVNKLLTELSPSKIHLSLDVHSRMSFDYEVEDIQGLPKPQVENLTMETGGLPSLSCYALFDGLFRICRPKFITRYLSHGSSFGDDFFCKRLVQGMNEKCSIRSHCMYGLHDIKEVNVQIFDEVVAVWRDLPWKSFLDASTSSKDKQKIRFQLK